MTLSIQDMLTPVSDSERSGVSVEYDTGYQLLEEQAFGTPPNEMGDSVVPGKDPDINKLIKNTEELWTKSRDLRVAVFWTYARLAKSDGGLNGLSDGLQVLVGLVSDFWESFWPQLDPDDDNDPTERVNILRMLSPQPGAYGDSMFFIRKLRSLRAVDEKPQTVRDVMVAEGMIDAEDEHVDPALLNAEMLTVPATSMQARLTTIEEILQSLDALETTANERMGDTGYIEFSTLRKDLEFLKRFYQRYTNRTDAQAPATGAQPTAASVQAQASTAAATSVAAVTDIRSIHLTNREDALFLLKKCSDFFQATEPTSPLPFLIRRALRMADMDFIQLLGEIDSNALERGREQLGVPRPDDSY